MAKKEFSEFSESIERAREELEMIVRYYEGDRYKIISSPAGYSYRLKPPKKGSRWVNSKQTYATPDQAKTPH